MSQSLSETLQTKLTTSTTTLTLTVSLLASCIPPFIQIFWFSKMHFPYLPAMKNGYTVFEFHSWLYSNRYFELNSVINFPILILIKLASFYSLFYPLPLFLMWFFFDRHAAFKKRLYDDLRSKRIERENREKLMTQTYARLAQEWARKVDKVLS